MTKTLSFPTLDQELIAVNAALEAVRSSSEPATCVFAGKYNSDVRAFVSRSFPGVMIKITSIGEGWSLLEELR